jgi:hypothetical protein
MKWLVATERTAFAGFAGGLRRDLAAVRAALSLPWSTGPVEGQISPPEDDQAHDVQACRIRSVTPSRPRSRRYCYVQIRVLS